MPNVLSMEHVAKRYGRHAVLRDASLSLGAGECVAVMGPNGSGKSTLLRVAAGLTPPSGGTVFSSVKPEYVPDTFPRIDLKLSVLLKALGRIDGADAEALARAMGLEGALNESIRNFSKGMLSKLAAIQALIAKPRLLLLDEPVSGQDEPSRRLFYREVRTLMDGGAAVLLACHDLALVRILDGRVLTLRDGMLATGDREGADRCLCGQCEKFRLGLCGGREGFSHA